MMLRTQSKRALLVGYLLIFVLIDLRLLNTLRAGGLPADLLAGPPGRMDGTVRELAVASRLADHRHQPFGAVELREFAVRERIREIANNAHRGPQQALAAVLVDVDAVEELEDRLNVRRQERSFSVLACKNRVESDSKNLPFSPDFRAAMIPPHASMIPSRRDIT